MKRFLNISLILCVLMLCVVLVSLGADAAEISDGFEYTILRGEVTITDYTGSAAELVIPATIEGYPVTGIGQKAFNKCSFLTSVTIPESITRIEKNAFQGCSGLEGIYITDIAAWCNICFEDSSANPLEIAGNLYLNNELVTDLVIPGSVNYINEVAFWGCASLQTVTIEEGVTGIGVSAFMVCSNLTTVTLPDSLTCIEDTAFSDCYSLTNIKIPDGITYIGGMVFMACESLQFNIYENCRYLGSDNNPYIALIDTAEWELDSVKIHPDTKIIVEWAFMFCSTAETQLIIPDGVTYIGVGAFSSCGNLTKVSLPDSVITVEHNAFPISDILQYNIYDNAKYLGNSENPYVMLMEAVDTEITRCTIHPDTKLINAEAFYSCSKLTEITIGNKVTTIGGYAFSECSSLKTVTIPDSVTMIGENAFYKCESLTDATIGSGVASIGEGAFWDCDKLEGIWVSEDNSCYSSDVSGVLFDENKTVLIQAPAGLSGNYEIPDSVTEIRYYAFHRCEGLTGITIPDKVTTIEKGLFEFCVGLTSVTIGKNVSEIGEAAFYGCEYLTEITFKGDAPIIGDDCFGIVTATAYYPENNATWTEEVRQNYGRNITWEPYFVGIPGDLDGLEGVDNKDVEFLLWHTLYPEDYPLLQDADYNGDGYVDNQDVEYLLWHTLYPEDFPLV